MRTRRLTEGELADAGPWWDALLARSRADCFFLRHVWLTAWWRRFSADRELRVVVAEDPGGRVVGVAPWCLSRVTDNAVRMTEIGFLGREGITGDYLDVFSEPGREGDVLRACLDHLMRERDWDILRMSDVPEASPTLAVLAHEASERGLPALPGEAQTCAYLPLASTWEAFLGTISPNLRSNLRRREKKLAALGARIEEANGSRLGPALDALFALHGARWEMKGQTGNFADARLRAFHHEIAPVLDREGAIGLWTAVLDGRPAAAIYGFRHRGRFLYYQAGFDPAFADHGVGLAVMGHAVRRSIECGITEFDYLRGDEPYKRRWTSLARRTHTLVLARPSLKSLAWRTLSSGKARAKRLLRRA